MIRIMIKINEMNGVGPSFYPGERESAADKIGAMLKKRKLKSEDNPELALFGVSSIRMTMYQQPQSVTMVESGEQKEKQIAMEKLVGSSIDQLVKQGTQKEEGQGQNQQGVGKQSPTCTNLPLNSDPKTVQTEVPKLYPGLELIIEAGRKTTSSNAVYKEATSLQPGHVNETGREAVSEKSVAGSVGVLHPNVLAEQVLHKAAQLSEIARKPSEQLSHYDSEKTPLKSEEILKYHFRKWGGDHSVTVKEGGAGNTLLRPSDEYVSYRLDQALKEKGEYMWLLDDDSGEHKHPHHDPDDGDESD